MSYDGKTVTLGIASSYARDWLEKKALNSIRSALEFHLDTTGLQIQFVVMSREQQRSAAARTTRAASSANDAQTALPLDEPDEAHTLPRKPVEAVRACALRLSRS